MTDEITPELFEHLVELAALALDPTQSSYLRRELNQQLKVIQELEAIPLDESVPPALHGVPYPLAISQPPRADIWQPFLNPESIIAQAPEVDNGYIIVPDIPHTKLD
jgi:aspartyl-tRNA(Asn)/glutamyl-tRNA(Gln) amidotransferase subunit C